MTDSTTDDIEHPELETVFATSQADLIPVIKSVLDAAEIPYLTDGEAMMNLFPSDLLGPTLHRARGEVCFQVTANRAEEARAVLTQHSDVPYPEELAEDTLIEVVEGDDDGNS